MSHILSFKLPYDLLDRLEKFSRVSGTSKGALVRKGLELLLQKSETSRASWEALTEAMRSNRRTKVKVDWEELRRKAQASAPSMTPEEEVRYHRRRGL